MAKNNGKGKKVDRKPTQFKLCAVNTDDEGIMTFTEVPLPEDFEPTEKNKTRNAYKRAVRAALESGGKNVEHYNGKPLAVVAFVDTFKYTAKVETTTVETVSVSEE